MLEEFKNEMEIVQSTNGSPPESLLDRLDGTDGAGACGVGQDFGTTPSINIE